MADDSKDWKDSQIALDDQREIQIRESLGICRPGIPRGQPPDAATLAILARAIVSNCCVEPIGSISAVAQIFNEAYDSLGLDDEERAEFKSEIVVEFERRPPKLLKAATYVDFVKIVALRSALPAIQARATRFFYRKGVPFAMIEELSGDVVVKVLKSLDSGKAYRGNAGAFVAKIRFRVLIDSWRRQKHRDKMLNNRSGPEAVERDDSARRKNWFLLIENLAPDWRAIVERIRWEGKIRDAAKALGMSTKKLRAFLQEIELP